MLEFTWPDGEQPVVTRAVAGLDAERFINPGAVIAADDGTLHMYANVFTSWPGPTSVMHLTSLDGIDWRLSSPEAVLTNDEIPFTEMGVDVSTGYVMDDGTWVLIFETVNLTVPWELGRATASTPDGPWVVDPEPILSPGSDGSLDAGGLAWPSVVRTNEGYAMYYGARAAMSDRGGVIAMATSPDGVEWTKVDGAVLVPTEHWEGRFIDRPRVALIDGRHAMVYAGTLLTNRGLAWSEDGRSWERAGSEPVITAEDFPIDASGSWDGALIAGNGELTFLIEIGNGSTTTDVYRAVARLP